MSFDTLLYAIPLYGRTLAAVELLLSEIESVPVVELLLAGTVRCVPVVTQKRSSSRTEDGIEDLSFEGTVVRPYLLERWLVEHEKDERLDERERLVVELLLAVVLKKKPVPALERFVRLDGDEGERKRFLSVAWTALAAAGDRCVESPS